MRSKEACALKHTTEELKREPSMIGFKEAKKQEDDRNGRKATSINEHILTVSKIYKTQGMPKTLLCRVGWLAYHQCRLCLMHQTLDHLLRRN